MVLVYKSLHDWVLLGKGKCWCTYSSTMVRIWHIIWRIHCESKSPNTKPFDFHGKRFLGISGGSLILFSITGISKVIKNCCLLCWKISIMHPCFCHLLQVEASFLFQIVKKFFGSIYGWNKYPKHHWWVPKIQRFNIETVYVFPTSAHLAVKTLAPNKRYTLK